MRMMVFFSFFFVKVLDIILLEILFVYRDYCHQNDAFYVSRLIF